MMHGKMVLFIHLILISVCAYPLMFNRHLQASDPVGKMVIGVVAVGLTIIGLISFFPGLFYGDRLPNTVGSREGWEKEAEIIRNVAIVPALGFLPIFLITLLFAPHFEHIASQGLKSKNNFRDVMLGYCIWAGVTCVVLYDTASSHQQP